MATTSHNPFRAPAQKPVPTGTSESTQQHENTPSNLPPPPPSEGDSTRELQSELETELPPAYTPAADINQGEATLEYGPVRPFQRPPPPPQHHPPPAPLQPQYTASTLQPQFTPSTRSTRPRGLLSQLTGELNRQLTNTAREFARAGTYHRSNHSNFSSFYAPAPSTPQHTGGSWSAYPGQQHHFNYTGNNSLPPRPPQHPQQHARSVSSPHSPVPVSDFARDFYAAGTGPPPVAGLSISDNSHPSSSTPNLPSTLGPELLSPRSPTQPTTHGYAPPPGSPPPVPQRPRSASPTPRNQIANPSSTPGLPDDGRPTQLPTPGHPLMRNGKVLVYPKGYVCDKCHNVGYKHADPLNPCKKCWQKYAKDFKGPLVWADWSNRDSSSIDASSSNTLSRHRKQLSGSTFQRPLPNFIPPQNRGHPSTPTAPQPQGPGMSSFYGSSAYAPPAPNAPQNHVPAEVYADSSYHDSTNANMYAPSGPNGNGIMVYPGDPRIGGRMCWSCQGRGRELSGGLIGALLGDEKICTVCRGLGRLL